MKLMPYLVYLPPLFCGLVGESFVNDGHDLVQLLAETVREAAAYGRRIDRLIMCSLSDLLHQCS